MGVTGDLGGTEYRMRGAENPARRYSNIESVAQFWPVPAKKYNEVQSSLRASPPTATVELGHFLRGAVLSGEENPR